MKTYLYSLCILAMCAIFSVSCNDKQTNVTGVSLDKPTLSLSVGGKDTLKATVMPDNADNKNVVWSSDKPEIATVDKGVVTAVAAGTATITVTTEDGKKTATCMVTVTAVTTPVAVTGVTLIPTTLSLEVGATGTLTTTVAPENATNKNLTWASDKPEFATVDANGKVTAVAAGTATITVKTEDGNKTATCEVTVIPVGTAVAVTGVILIPTTLSLEVGATGTLTTTVAPENATNKNLTWASDKPEFATVDADGTVTAVAAGTAIITVTTVDGNKMATCTVTVTPADIAFFNGLSTDATWDSYPTTTTNCTFTMIDNKLPLSSTVKMEGANSSLHFSWKTAWVDSDGDGTADADGWDARVPFDNNWIAQDISTKTHLVIQLYVGEGSIYKWAMPYIKLENETGSENLLQLRDYVDQNLIDNSDSFNYEGWYKIVIPIADFGALPQGGIKTIAFGNWNADDAQHDLYIGYLAFTKP